MIGRCLSRPPVEGLVAPRPNERLQLHRDRQFLNRLVVDGPAGRLQLGGHAAVAVPAPVPVKDLSDLGLQITMLVDGLESLLLIVKATARQASSPQQTGKREMRPQLDHDQRPFAGTERVLTRTKACASFRYAFSVRSC